MSGAVAWPLGALAQTERPNFLRVGTASPTPRVASTSFLTAFEQRMAELGYTDGKNFALEFIQLAQPNEWGDAFKELVRRKVEASLKSAMAASDKIPIVMVAIDYDPFRKGYAATVFWDEISADQCGKPPVKVLKKTACRLLVSSCASVPMITRGRFCKRPRRTEAFCS
jgi:hypothetical protein